MKKKTITLLSVLLIILCFAFPAQAASKKDKAINAYREFLTQKEVLENTSTGDMFGIAYLNNDNIPDLVMYYKRDFPVGKACVYTYKNNKVVLVSFNDSDCYYSKYYKKKSVVLGVPVFKGSSKSYKNFFSVKFTTEFGAGVDPIVSQENGKYFKYDPKSDGGRTQITKKKFNKLLKKKIGSTKATKIKYYKKTKENVNRYLKSLEKSITLNKEKIEIVKGDKYKLIATVTGMNKTVTWSSSNKKIATVKKGVVTGKKKGTATITAECGGKKATCKVTVKKCLDAETAYMQYMKDNCESWAPSTLPVYYMLYDVDLDGVKELFVRIWQGAKGRLMLFGFDGKDVYPLIENGGGIGVIVRPGKNQLLVCEGTQVYVDYTAYKIEGKKLVKLYTMHEDSLQREKNYEYNGSVTTEENFNKYRQLFTISISPEIEFKK